MYRVSSVGFSTARRLLVVVHTEEADDRLRIISARETTARERKRYEAKS